MALLDEVIAGEPAERALTRWSRASRFAGSKDRAAIRDTVFDALRRRRSCLWRSGQTQESGRALVIGLLAADAPEDLALFDGDGYSPPPLDDAERGAIRSGVEGAPDPVAFDYPDFLDAELDRSLGPDKRAVMAVLQSRAPVDLRVNLLKADLNRARAALAAERFEVEPVAGAPTALRVTGNARQVAASQAYRIGLVELQDAASQVVADALDAQPGMKVLDLCAGGGGKTLAVGARMAGRGTLVAYDINPRRMQDLPGRAARAGLKVQIADDAGLARATGFFDRILIDAPCSGTGSWRRNPDHKWRLTQAELAGLVRTQASILDRAADLLAPGGRIVYATCSILRCENEDQVAAFLDRAPTLGALGATRLRPGDTGDGFFHCLLGARAA